MEQSWPGGDGARQTNDAFASAYDDFNLRYRNVQWTSRLLARARAAGLKGNRLLDVACGTGHSLIPMLRWKFEVTGCDVSAEMLARAKDKIGNAARLEQADMRDLPIFGSFDLVWALNDPLNYLLADEELRSTLAGMASNLDREGFLIFDVNTINTYRTFFAQTLEVKARNRRLIWRGLNDPDTFQPGDFAEAQFEAVGEQNSAHVHRQRHFPAAQVLDAIKGSSLKCVEFFGVSEPEGNFEGPLDEDRHTKAVYLCQLA
ncbi:MAG TPA: class I SAM-dependent methyltransferase [Solirubrobacterales bacterium]|nr:class I SAM-dependent methyltransferase [Solirubrobacterales bacterium]